MSSTKKNGNALLSAAAAALLASAPLTVSAEVETPEQDASIEGKCWGVNACKGYGSCKAAYNTCQGKNSCKGQGFLIISLQTCIELGGDFAEGESSLPVEN